MQKGTVVLVSCEFRRGGFPNERIFTIKTDRGEHRGITDVRYCQGENNAPLGDEPAVGGVVPGRLLGVIVRNTSPSYRVHLPDGDVYDLDGSIISSASGERASHVPV